MRKMNEHQKLDELKGLINGVKRKQGKHTEQLDRIESMVKDIWNRIGGTVPPNEDATLQKAIDKADSVISKAEGAIEDNPVG